VAGAYGDLSQTSVFLDFDGTISSVDVGRHLLAHAAASVPDGSPIPDGSGWWDLHQRYERGEIGSRECLFDQWALIEGDESTLRALAGEVALDPGFEPLVRALRAAGAEVMVVSDGFGFYVDQACAGLDLRVLTNAVDFASGQLAFPHEDRCCPCSTCGVCKQAPIKDARHQGRTAVLVGDGASDRKAALLADVVFAKAGLADWCDAFGVDCVRFETLDDVHRVFVGGAG